MTAYAYCAMPLPNDQFSFWTSKRFTKMFSGLMPRFLARSPAMRVERLLFIGGARVVDGDLNDHEIVIAGNPEIGFAVKKIAFVIFVDRHETIVLRHVENLTHRLIKTVHNSLAIFRRLAFQ
jgi:hypothetical protein